jgi:IMP cyclohydrolase
MYGESEYEKMHEVTPLIEKAIAEVEAYLGGKYADEIVQLPLFAR